MREYSKIQAGKENTFENIKKDRGEEFTAVERSEKVTPRSRYSHFFLENKYNGNHTFVGSTCIRNINPRVTTVIRYFKHIMEKDVQGIYKGQDNPGLQRFEVNPNTVLVRRLKDVEHLNPQITRNLEGQWEVIVQYPNAETLVEGQKYSLQLKAKYQRGHLTFTAL